MAEVVVRDLSKQFSASRKAVAEISISIHDGELLSVIGAAGSGKTTFLRLIAGLETPDAGTIAFDGNDVTHKMPAKRNVAMVFQRDSLWPHLCVRDNLLFGSRLRATRSLWQRLAFGGRTAQPVERVRELEKQADELADLLKIAHLLHRMPHELSGGESQRVAIARALMRRPNVLLMDEPFAHLDWPARGQLTRELKCLQKQFQFTTIVVSHDQHEAFAIGDRMAIFADGRLAQLDTPDEVLEHPRNEEIALFVGNPDRNGLRRTTSQEERLSPPSEQR